VLDESAPDGPLFHDNGWVRAVRHGPWKLIAADREGARFPEFRLRGDPPEMLFRLDLDPEERVNLRDAEPAKASELRALLDARFAPIAAAVPAAAPPAVPPSAAPQETEEAEQKRRSRLRALGYVE
jgi:hypothetical protein